MFTFFWDTTRRRRVVAKRVLQNVFYYYHCFVCLDFFNVVLAENIYPSTFKFYRKLFLIVISLIFFFSNIIVCLIFFFFWLNIKLFSQLASSLTVLKFLLTICGKCSVEMYAEARSVPCIFFLRTAVCDRYWQRVQGNVDMSVNSLLICSILFYNSHIVLFVTISKKWSAWISFTFYSILYIMDTAGRQKTWNCLI